MTAYDQITARLLDLLEHGTIPWRKPWRGGIPANLFTKKEYRGINTLMLGWAKFASPYWATERQIEDRGGFVKVDAMDSPSTIFFTKLYRYNKWNARGYAASDMKLIFRAYDVFNAEQTEGVERFWKTAQIHHEPISVAEELVQQMPERPIILVDLNSAHYSPRKDCVALPPSDRFPLLEEYYCTLFHELLHSTGHQRRLNRETLTEMARFGDHAYSEEELVAEIGAAMLCGLSGIEQKTLENSAGYIQHWSSKLGNDNRLILRAANQAQRACDFIRNKLQSQAVKSPAKPQESRRQHLFDETPLHQAA